MAETGKLEEAEGSSKSKVEGSEKVRGTSAWEVRETDCRGEENKGGCGGNVRTQSDRTWQNVGQSVPIVKWYKKMS